MTRVLLVRHGDTDAVGRYHAGRAAGVLLNAEGRRQVERLVAVLHDVPIAAIVSSPLERTRDTAQPVAADHDLRLELDQRLIEVDVGAWTGAAFDALASDERWQRFNAARSVTAPPGGELMIDVQQRAVSAILDLRDRFASATVMIVSHGDVLRAMLMYFLGMPIDFVHRFEVSPARVSILEIDGFGVRVLQVNGDSGTPPL